jgi:hypothetical protein
VSDKRTRGPYRARLNGGNTKYEPSVELLYKRVRVDETTGCHVWTGKLNHNGYGRIGINYKDVLAHRLSYELQVGPIPSDLFVCHKCDNRACINPAHFFLGTLSDNHADMVKKGRNTRGESQWLAKLKDDYVRVIRLLKWDDKETAKLFGVTPSNIKHIRERKRWTHVL